MSIRRYKPGQIVSVLRQIEVQMATGKTAPQACKEAGIHNQTYYRWRRASVQGTATPSKIREGGKSRKITWHTGFLSEPV